LNILKQIKKLEGKSELSEFDLEKEDLRDSEETDDKI
jgi:hypothetical protein